MNPLVFLLIPVVIVIVASVVMWLRGRQPQTLHSGIDSFQREMHALSPDGSASRNPRRFDADDSTRSPRSPRPDRDA